MCAKGTYSQHISVAPGRRRTFNVHGIRFYIFVQEQLATSLGRNVGMSAFFDSRNWFAFWIAFPTPLMMRQQKSAMSHRIVLFASVSRDTPTHVRKEHTHTHISDENKIVLRCFHRFRLFYGNVAKSLSLIKTTTQWIEGEKKIEKGKRERVWCGHVYSGRNWERMFGTNSVSFVSGWCKTERFRSMPLSGNFVERGNNCAEFYAFNFFYRRPSISRHRNRNLLLQAIKCHRWRQCKASSPHICVSYVLPFALLSKHFRFTFRFGSFGKCKMYRNIGLSLIRRTVHRTWWCRRICYVTC